MGRRTLRRWVCIDDGSCARQGQGKSRVWDEEEEHEQGNLTFSLFKLLDSSDIFLFLCLAIDTCCSKLTLSISISNSSSFTSSIRSALLQQQWVTPRHLASLYIPSQDNEDPQSSALIGQQEIPLANGSPDMACHHRAPPMNIHGGGAGLRGVQVLWFEKGGTSSSPIKEVSQVDFPRFLILFGSVLVVYKLGSNCSLQSFLMAIPIQCLILLSSRYHHVVFSIFFTKKLFTLEVLDLQKNCEEYINILHNQYPLLTLYISMEHLLNLVNQH